MHGDDDGHEARACEQHEPLPEPRGERDRGGRSEEEHEPEPVALRSFEPQPALEQDDARD